jgi:hypothetical protein
MNRNGPIAKFRGAIEERCTHEQLAQFNQIKAQLYFPS